MTHNSSRAAVAQARQTKVGARHGVLLLAALWCWPPAAVTAQDIAPAELIRLYERTLEPFQRATFSVRTRTYVNHRALPADGPVQESTSRIWRDKHRWKRVDTSTSRQLEKGKTRVNKTAHEIVFPGKGSFTAILDPGTGRPAGLLVQGRDLTEEESNSGPHPKIAIVASGVIYMTRYPLPEVLKKSKVTARRATLGRETCWLLEGRGDWGHVSLWLDPQRGFLPLRILVYKEREDQVFLEGDRVLRVNTMPAHYQGPWKSSRQQIDVTRFTTIDGRQVITGFTQTLEVTLSTNTTSLTKDVVEISDINFRPSLTDASFTITTSIPDGMKVTVDEQRGIEYEWRGGRIVKAVDQSAVARLGGNWFQGGSLMTRGTMLLAAVAASLAAVLFALRRRSTG